MMTLFILYAPYSFRYNTTVRKVNAKYNTPQEIMQYLWGRARSVHKVEREHSRRLTWEGPAGIKVSEGVIDMPGKDTAWTSPACYFTMSAVKQEEMNDRDFVRFP